MIKFLTILLLIVLGGMLLSSYILKKLKGFVETNFGHSTRQEENGNLQKSEVLYNKDDIVVLKGEAGKQNNGEKS